MNQRIFVYRMLSIFTILFLIPFSFINAQEIKLEKLIKDSRLIIIGNVINIQSKWGNERKNIWTYVTVDIKQYLKGDNTENELIIRIPGGELNDIGEYVTGTPKYKIGEYVLTFLGKDIEKYYYVNGWEDGKFTFKDGSWTKKNIKYSEQFITSIESIVKQQSK